MSEDPKPVDEAPPAEIRGGNRPSDYITEPVIGKGESGADYQFGEDDELAEGTAQAGHGGGGE